MTRKTFVLSLGLVALGSTLKASERARGTDSDVATQEESAPVVDRSDIRMVGPGEAIVTINGAELKLYANNQVSADEVEQAYGSIDRYAFESQMAGTLKSKDPDGMTIYASNAVGYFSDLLGTSPDVQHPAPKTAEEFKENHVWTEALIGGQTVLLFASNMVIADPEHVSETPEWAKYASRVPNRTTETGERIYVTNAIFPEPVVESKDGQ